MTVLLGQKNDLLGATVCSIKVQQNKKNLTRHIIKKLSHIERKLTLINTTSAASTATSVPDDIAIPTSA